MRLSSPALRLAVGFAVAIGLTGCGSASEPEPPAGPTQAATVPLAATRADPVEDRLPPVIARVNGRAIPREDFERAIRAAEAQAPQAVSPQSGEEVYRGALDRLVAFHLLLQESEARGLVVEEAEMDTEIARIRSTFPSVYAFEQRLAEWQTSLDVLREETRKDLLIAKVIELEVLPKLSLNEDGVRAFYDEHREEFREPAAIRTSHILIGIAPGADVDTRRRLRDAAEALVVRARAGADFGALARDHSTDEGTAANGGDLGFITRGQTVPPFEAALFALDDGEISDVVESMFGFHVIRVSGRQGDRVVPYAAARDQIRLFLLEEERNVLTDAFLSELLAKGTIEIYI
jgi:peptidyl-prolyl cis-trans isomerase C